MKAPKVSVLVDCHGYGRFLATAVESVLSQEFADFEVIIGDDASGDVTPEVAARLAAADPRVRVFRNARNLGMVGNRNACLARARGEYAMFVHADDALAVPEALGMLVGELDAWAGAVMAFGRREEWDEGGRRIGESRERIPPGRWSGAGVVLRCLEERRNLVGPPTGVLFRRGLAGRGFREDLWHAADLEMWFHLLEKGCCAVRGDALAAYRWHAGQMTESDKATLRAEREWAAILAEYLERPYVTWKPWKKRHVMAAAARELWRASGRLGLPREGARHAAAPSVDWAMRQWRWAKRASAAGRGRSDGGLPDGINVCGFFGGEYGIGSASRAFALAALRSGLPVALRRIKSRVHSNADRSLGETGKANPYRINLMTFSADYSRRFRKDAGRRFFAGRRNIGQWYWELERFPVRWHAEFDFYDEIWAASAFCAEAFAAVSPVPVRRVPYPFEIRHVGPERVRLGLPEEDLLVLVTFDFHSVVERKNPGAAARAFREAFRADDRATLVVKTIHSAAHPEERVRFAAELEGLRAIWIESHWSGRDMEALFASCDVYLSLHRSEGLGLGLMQAMAAGKVAIGTGWSGNMEFMRPGNSVPVGFDLVELERDYGPYEAGNRWAEARVDEAAEALRAVFADGALRKRLGARAAADIREGHDPAKVGQIIAGMVGEL